MAGTVKVVTAFARSAMKFEDHVRLLCAQALAAHEEQEVRKTMSELRLVLHQHIEHLREKLQFSFGAADDRRSEKNLPNVLKTWQNVVREISIQGDARHSVQVRQRLNLLLQDLPESPTDPKCS